MNIPNDCGGFSVKKLRKAQSLLFRPCHRRGRKGAFVGMVQPLQTMRRLACMLGKSFRYGV